MSYSKRQLYELGMPLGESVTRHKLGGGYVCGGGGDSESRQSSSNYDQRVAVQDGIGLSGSSGNTISVQTVDAQIVGKALDSVNVSNALGADNFSKLLEKSGDMFGQSLDAMTKVFNEGQGLIGQTQKAVADAYGQAQNDKAGTIDNRTIIVLAVAGAAALVAMNKG